MNLGKPQAQQMFRKDHNCPFMYKCSLPDVLKKLFSDFFKNTGERTVWLFKRIQALVCGHAGLPEQ